MDEKFNRCLLLQVHCVFSGRTDLAAWKIRNDEDRAIAHLLRLGKLWQLGLDPIKHPDDNRCGVIIYFHDAICALH